MYVTCICNILGLSICVFWAVVFVTERRSILEAMKIETMKHFWKLYPQNLSDGIYVILELIMEQNYWDTRNGMEWKEGN